MLASMTLPFFLVSALNVPLEGAVTLLITEAEFTLGSHPPASCASHHRALPPPSDHFSGS